MYERRGRLANPIVNCVLVYRHRLEQLPKIQLAIVIFVLLVSNSNRFQFRSASPSATFTMRAAVAQMTTSGDHARNFRVVQQIVQKAKERDADMVFLPEAFAFLGQHFTETMAQAEPILRADFSASCDKGVSAQHCATSSSSRTWLPKYLDLARAHDMWLSLGGYHEKILVRPGDETRQHRGTSRGEDAEATADGPANAVEAVDHEGSTTPAQIEQKETPPDRVYNSHLIVNPDGKIEAVYRKIHLFDVNIPNGPILLESRYTRPGTWSDDNLVVVKVPVRERTEQDDVAGAPDTAVEDTSSQATSGSRRCVNVGVTTCYDLRFPELYNALRFAKNADVLLVPSAFTVPTGKAHWELLLRARAVENQCYVLAAAQVGKHNGKRESYGHALAVDPWGRVLADCGGGVGDTVTDELKNSCVGEVVDVKVASEAECGSEDIAVNGPAARFALVDIDLRTAQEIREKMPLAAHKEAVAGTRTGMQTERRSAM